MHVGVLFAVEPPIVDRLRACADDEARLAFLVDVIEADSFESHPERLAELETAWDAIHRSLTDGDLGWDNGREPWNLAILGGEQLYDGDDYIISLKSPAQVGAIATALATIQPADLRAGYQQIDADDYDGAKGLEDFQATWESFAELPGFYRRAAEAGWAVLFTVDM